MKNFVLDCYENYKIYMDFKEILMPNINVIIEDTNLLYDDLSNAHINAKEVYEKIYKIYVSSKLFSYNEHFQKSILFHEFTHIYDSLLLSKQYEYKDFVTLLATYSEFHASQIELAYNIGFRNIHSFSKYNQNKTKILHKNDKILVHEDYLLSLSALIDIIDVSKEEYMSLSASEYYKKYFLFEKNTMYYLGKKNFENIYAYKPKPDLLNEYCGEFTNIIREIEKSIKNKNYDLVIENQKMLLTKYRSYFPCKNAEFIL